MPPMKAAAAKKAPGKPSAPKKPTSRSKTGNSACSQAASNWQLAIRGKAPLDPDTYKTLGKCRAMSRASKSADDRADMGYNLSEQGRIALKGRLQKRFDQGLITQKSRQDRLKTLLAQRKEKQATAATAPASAPAPAPASKPIDKAASLVAAVRQKPGYENTRLNKADVYKRGVREKLISTFVQDAIAGRRVPRKILDDMRDVRNSWISEAGLMSARNDTRLPDYNTRPTFYMRPPVSLKGSALRNIETKASNVRKFWGVGEDEEGRMDTTPLLHKAQASAAARKAGKKHKAYKQLNATPAPAPAPAPASKPIDKAASLVAAVRQKPGYENTRLNKADVYKRGVREKLISTFVQDAIAGRRVPSKILDDMRDVRNSWISEAGGNAIRLPDHNTRPTFYMRPPSFLKGSVKRSIEKKASNVRKFWGVDDNDGGINTTPLLHKAQASAAARKAGKKHKAYKQLNATPAPAPAPAPAKFSRGGQLAPGRGTEERASLAKAKAESRRLINETTIRVSSSSFNYQSYHPEKRAKGYSDGYTREIRSNMRKQLKRAKTANDAEVINDVLRQHAAGMKSRVSTWANAESRTASWAVTGRGNFNASRNSKRIDSAMNKQLEITDYANGLENAVSRALLKKSDTGNTITRLARIRKRLERRKSELNRGKQGLVRDRVYALRGVDKFYNASKEVRVEALKSSTRQLERIDKDRKTVLGRLKKISSAESKLKQQTRIARAL